MNVTSSCGCGGGGGDLIGLDGKGEVCPPGPGSVGSLALLSTVPLLDLNMKVKSNQKYSFLTMNFGCTSLFLKLTKKCLTEILSKIY